MRRGTEDRLYQAIQYGKEKGPPVRWDGAQQLGWSRAAATGSDMPWRGGLFYFFSHSMLSLQGNSCLSVGIQSGGLHFQSRNSKLAAAGISFT